MYKLSYKERLGGVIDMRNGKTFKRLLSLAVLPCAIFSSSCAESSKALKQLKQDGTYNEILSQETIEAVDNYYLDYNLDYSSRNPGQNYSEELLWRGYDNDRYNGCYGSKTKRLSTYLSEYGEDENDIILAYLKNDDIAKYQEYLSNEKTADYNNMFSEPNDTSKIDGKYLYAYQRDEDKGDALLFACENISDICLSFDDYTLAFAAKRKPVKIKEDITSGIKYENKTIYAYHQIRLEFGGLWKKPSLMEDDYAAMIMDYSASYVGERLDAYATTYADSKALYSPLLGMETVSTTFMNFYCNAEIVTVDSKRCVSLPHYSDYGTEHQVDLLSSSTSINFLNDVYFEAREDFKNALVKDLNPNNDYGDGLFDYDKVVEIVKKYHSI